MQREIGKDIEPGRKRIAFLSDNCEKIEEKAYSKRFTPEQLAKKKEELSAVAIDIRDIEIEKKEAATEFKARLEPLDTQRKQLVSELKSKAATVVENCYKFVDQDEREVGYYNQDGDLIESRPAFPEEIQQGNIFRTMERPASGRTGTDN